MKIYTVIIDDDADSRLVLDNYIKKNCFSISVVGEAATMQAAIALIEKSKPNLLLLDINLPDGTGFDLLKQIKHTGFEVIFITAYDSYAIEAFKISAIDYLLKPIDYSVLGAALRKVENRIEEKGFKNHWESLLHNMQYKTNHEKKLAITTTNGYFFIPIKDIVRLESQSNYTHFYLDNGKKLLSSHHLGYYEELLHEDKFCRIHNSHLVNIDFIEGYNRSGVGGTVIMKGGMELNVSQRKKEDFLSHLIPKTK
jgi:two-component system, LytTR family, response regulator